MIHSIGDRVVATSDTEKFLAVIYPVPHDQRDRSQSAVYSNGMVWVRIDGRNTSEPWPSEKVRRHS